MAELNIRIMLLVGSNGKSNACIEGHMGWGDLADGIMDHVPGHPATDPDASTRHIVTVTLPRPKAVSSEIPGEVSHG